MSETNTTATTTGTAKPNPGAAGQAAKRASGQMAKEVPSGKTNTTNVDAAKQSEQSKVEEPKKYKFEKIKYKGKEQDLELQDEEAKRLIQRGLGSNEAYEEAKKLREDAERKYAEYQRWQASQEEHKKKLITNPIQAAIESGASPQEVRKVAEEYLLGEIQKDEMSAEAREAIQLKAELKKRDEAEAKRIKDEEQNNLQRAAHEERNKIVPEMMKWMDSVGVAKTAANLSNVARRLQAAAKRKIPMSIERAVQLTHEDNMAFVNSTVGGQTKAINDAYKNNDFDTVLKIGKEIEGFLGPEVFVALQRYGIVKWKAKAPNMPNQVIDTAKTKAQAPERPSYLTTEQKEEERKKRVEEAQRRWEASRGAASSV